MHPEDGLTFPDVRASHGHLTVETTRAQQRRVKDVGAVRGRHDDDSLVAFEAVHFYEQLIECLLAFVMSPA